MPFGPSRERGELEQHTWYRQNSGGQVQSTGAQTPWDVIQTLCSSCPCVADRTFDKLSWGKDSVYLAFISRLQSIIQGWTSGPDLKQELQVEKLLPGSFSGSSSSPFLIFPWTTFPGSGAGQWAVLPVPHHLVANIIPLRHPHRPMWSRWLNQGFLLRWL